MAKNSPHAIFCAAFKKFSHPVLFTGVLFLLVAHLGGCDSTSFNGEAQGQRKSKSGDPNTSKNSAGKDTKAKQERSGGSASKDQDESNTKHKANLSPDDIELTEWEGCCQGIVNLGPVPIELPYAQLFVRFKKSDNSEITVKKVIYGAYTNPSCTQEFRHPAITNKTWPENMSSRLHDMEFEEGGKKASGKEQVWVMQQRRFVMVPVTLTVDDKDQLSIHYQYPQGLTGKGNCKFKPKH